jgi:uncharacterized membrane protein YsdA (DUF1294 family)/cold shock CspA family protein
MRYTGKIANWRDDRGFGFITQKSDGNRVFVHISSFVNRQRRPARNEIVSFELKTDAQGRYRAANVAFSDEPLPIVTPAFRSKIPLIFVSAFVAFVGTATFIGRLPKFVLGAYLVTSTIAFIAYAFDKHAAKNDRWRIQESTLHFFAVVGGWPGALAAQRLLHHKSRKKSFKIAFWSTVVLNCGALGYLFTPSGEAFLRSAILHIGG